MHLPQFRAEPSRHREVLALGVRDDNRTLVIEEVADHRTDTLPGALGCKHHG